MSCITRNNMDLFVFQLTFLKFTIRMVAKSSTNFAVIRIFFPTTSSGSSFLMAAMASMVWYVRSRFAL